MKHLNFILTGLFFLCGLCCRAQVLPLEENVVLNTKEGQIKGKLLLPGGVKTCPVVLIIAGSGPTDMDGNSAIGNLRNNSLKFLAKALSALFDVTLVYCFEKKGVLRDENDDDSVIPQITRVEFEQYVADGVIQGGMIPKLENSFEAINAGVSEVVITLASAINNSGGTRIKK